MDCFLCKKSYNLENPELHPFLLQCRHTLCKKCITEIVESKKQCPCIGFQCNITKSISEVKVNHALIEILSSKKQINNINLISEKKLEAVEGTNSFLLEGFSKVFSEMSKIKELINNFINISDEDSEENDKFIDKT